ncbi:hypothetical protein K505DRAFT_297324 [Melanomma pulvis-pyrius CBS 109.77]|uniref:CENP-V/GFA domain-containing protein n=1 Tax=Melanomma pulvis-pyrius CBS 109.77 TaxID=1314802 RepID=A0A6A6XNV7_9PLEO|nr:hypothetical protein K505DRAFT_297324 [Melanomma pulvis-pyrius CBS 109.77]
MPAPTTDQSAAAAASDISKPYIPLASLADDGWSTEDEATATCFCGKVQLVLPTKAPGLVNTFVCNCTDCHKITASMFASNMTVLDTHSHFTRGEDNLSTFAQRKTVGSGNLMTNYFCKTCGTLMYRISEPFPEQRIARIGTIDDFHLHATKFKPSTEQFVRSRVEWFGGCEDAKQVQGNAFPS